MSVKVKICGVCSVADARAAVAAGADFLGLNFHRDSPRYLEPEAARELAEAVPGVPLVGVFVDAPRPDVVAVAEHVGLSALQFHGEEDPAYCTGWSWRTIKALRARPGEDLRAGAARYATDYILIDAYRLGVPGGTGVPIDPALARGIDPARLFIAGGLRPETVAAAVGELHPFAVDVASGVESRPREKDHAKLEEFVRRAKAA